MSNQSSRFGFPGFDFVAAKDTPTHEVETGTITEDGGYVLRLELIRNNQYPSLPFVLARIDDISGNLLWNFKQEGFDGVGLLARAGDTNVIALVGRGKEGKVERIIPFSKLLPGSSPVDLRRSISLKVAAAEFLDRDYTLTAAEDLVNKSDKTRQQSEAAMQREIDAAARETARQERIAAILARGKIECYTADGRKRYGLPMLESEWVSFPHGTYVVRVESIGEDGKPAGVVEAFQVLKERGKNPKKGFSALVTLAPPPTATQTASVIKPVRSTVVEMDGGAYEVQLYASMDTIRQARAAGLNGGTLVAVKEADPKAKIQVYAVHHDRMDTLGGFAPLG